MLLLLEPTAAAGLADSVLRPVRRAVLQDPTSRKARLARCTAGGARRRRYGARLASRANAADTGEAHRAGALPGPLPRILRLGRREVAVLDGQRPHGALGAEKPRGAAGDGSDRPSWAKGSGGADFATRTIRVVLVSAFSTKLAFGVLTAVHGAVPHEATSCEAAGARIARRRSTEGRSRTDLAGAADAAKAGGADGTDGLAGPEPLVHVLGSRKEARRDGSRARGVGRAVHWTGVAGGLVAVFLVASGLARLTLGVHRPIARPRDVLSRAARRAHVAAERARRGLELRRGAIRAGVRAPEAESSGHAADALRPIGVGVLPRLANVAGRASLQGGNESRVAGFAARALGLRLIHAGRTVHAVQLAHAATSVATRVACVAPVTLTTSGKSKARKALGDDVAGRLRRGAPEVSIPGCDGKPVGNPSGDRYGPLGCPGVDEKLAIDHDVDGAHLPDDVNAKLLDFGERVVRSRPHHVDGVHRLRDAAEGRLDVAGVSYAHLEGHEGSHREASQHQRRCRGSAFQGVQQNEVARHVGVHVVVDVAKVAVPAVVAHSSTGRNWPREACRAARRGQRHHVFESAWSVADLHGHASLECVGWFHPRKTR
eukprot:scaffold2067_cov238-Pinguiococcus_pyrenoidosus.AAC.4